MAYPVQLRSSRAYWELQASRPTTEASPHVLSPSTVSAIRTSVRRSLGELPEPRSQPGAGGAVAAVHRALTNLASPPELAAAATQLAGVAPRLAAMLSDLATLSRQDFLACQHDLAG